ncbi:MAG: ParB/RepB/Spo0J family partition protein [Myxococcales bacterium]|nr:ParB/RepB/Spo0J family partition protein [Myxococcales bacterium]USN49818.1 MAG: ParB/RepB/Spo0J family partition protein [Myxococcales bacterium]
MAVGDRAQKTQIKNSHKSYKVVLLETATLKPSKGQPREIFDDLKLQELALSIKQYGVLQPILVRKSGSGLYEIIAGERRWRASKLALKKKIPCIVSNLINEEAYAVALVENIQREDLSPIEEANAYRRLVDMLGMSQEQIAERVGKDRATIANTLRLLRLPKEIQNMLGACEISMGHARALLSLDDKDLMLMTAKKIIREGLSVRRVESLIRSLKSGIKLSESPKNLLGASDGIDALTREIQKKFEYEFGLRVLLKKESGGNYVLAINFQTVSELNNILERFKIEI